MGRSGLILTAFALGFLGACSGNQQRIPSQEEIIQRIKTQQDLEAQARFEKNTKRDLAYESRGFNNLSNSGRIHPLAVPSFTCNYSMEKELTPEERKIKTEKCFDYWYRISAQRYARERR